MMTAASTVRQIDIARSIGPTDSAELLNEVQMPELSDEIDTPISISPISITAISITPISRPISRPTSLLCPKCTQYCKVDHVCNVRRQSLTAMSHDNARRISRTYSFGSWGRLKFTM